MATSGSKTVEVTSWDDLVFSWSVSSQSASGNYSVIAWTLKLVAGSSGRIDSTNQKSWSVTIDGTTKSGINTIGIANNATKTLASGTQTIYHDSKGEKVFSYSFSQQFSITFSGTSIGTKSGSGTGELPDLLLRSALTVSSGTLGTAQTMKIEAAQTSYKHKITYEAGTGSGYVAGSASTYASGTSITWTPPLDLLNNYSGGNGKQIQVFLKLYTYDSFGQSVGVQTKQVYYNIPDNEYTKPSCSISVTSSPVLYDDSSFFKGMSKLDVVITPIQTYGSPIQSYKTTVDGGTYTTTSFITPALKSSGTVTITVTVTNKRGFTRIVTKDIWVLDYAPVAIDKFIVERCTANGTLDPEGEYMRATISTTTSGEAPHNESFWKLYYKKASESESAYVEIDLGAVEPDTFHNLIFDLINAQYILPVQDGANSYDVRLVALDEYTSASRTVTVSTAFALMEYNIDKKAVTIGKRIEESNLFDVGLQARFMGGLKPPVLEPETDLNDVRTPNTYTGENVTTYKYANCPVTSGTFTLIVESGGEDGQVIQTYKTVSKYKPEIFVRHYYQGEWGEWFWSSTDEYVLYESSSGSGGAITLSASAAHYRYLEIYFTDNNGKSGGYAKVYAPNSKMVCLHITEAGTSIFSRQTTYTISGTTITPDTTNASYVKITSAGAVTTSIGTNYIRIIRVIGRA